MKTAYEIYHDNLVQSFTSLETVNPVETVVKSMQEYASQVAVAVRDECFRLKMEENEAKFGIYPEYVMLNGILNDYFDIV